MKKKDPSLEDFLGLPVKKKGSWHIGFWISVLLFVLGAVWLGQKTSSEDHTARRSQSPFAGQERLESILAEIQAAASSDGLEIRLGDLHPQFFIGREIGRGGKAHRSLRKTTPAGDLRESTRLLELWRKKLERAKTAQGKEAARRRLKWAHIRAKMTAIRREGVAYQKEIKR